jgi:hypothetical protein
VRRAEDELVGALVVEVDEARVGLERVRDAAGHELEHLLQVERRVDGADRLRQEREVPRRRIHAVRLYGGRRTAYRPRFVSRYDWFLFLHLLGAFAIVSTQTAFWALVFFERPPNPRLPPAVSAAIVRPLVPVIAAGALVALVFGVALAIDVDGYELWDGWILAAIVLWFVATGLGNRSGMVMGRARETDSRELWQRGVLLEAGASLALLAILWLMIFKPGA